MAYPSGFLLWHKFRIYWRNSRQLFELWSSLHVKEFASFFKKKKSYIQFYNCDFPFALKNISGSSDFTIFLSTCYGEVENLALPFSFTEESLVVFARNFEQTLNVYAWSLWSKFYWLNPKNLQQRRPNNCSTLLLFANDSKVDVNET